MVCDGAVYALVTNVVVIMLVSFVLFAALLRKIEMIAIFSLLVAFLLSATAMLNLAIMNTILC
jgi:hypothetical protein